MIRNKIITGTALIIAITLIVIGVIQNQPKDVLIKAINICLECVGIG